MTTENSTGQVTLPDGWRVFLRDSDCDRCGKRADKLTPFKLAETITFRGKVVEEPWLCLKCFKVEKRKWWVAQGRYDR